MASNYVGLDIGTMNIVASTMDSNHQITTKSMRNLFLKAELDSLGTQDISLISHVIIDNFIYILSEDAYTFGNIFGKQVSRPMSNGMISSSEMDSIDILGVIVKFLIGESSDHDSICCYSIPANPIDSNMNVLFHENVFGRIITQLGWTPISLDEGASIIYSQCSDTGFTGIGISFGAGMTNITVMFKGVKILNFSLARGGDWIDENAALITSDMVTNRITMIKEKSDFDLTNFKIGNKKEQRIREALSYYYNDLIKYTTDNIKTQLSSLDMNFPSEIPIVLSGGTSKAKGFTDLVKNILNQTDLPFSISDIKVATNPLTAVAEGCLIRSLKS